jgi:hypothetical protein
LVALEDDMMARAFLQDADEGGQSVIEAAVIGELNALLGVGLPCRGSRTRDYGTFLDDLSARTTTAITDKAYSFPRDETFELIALLTTGDEKNVREFVHDVAEILFLEREQRTEYIDTNQVTPPYRIHKLMLEYAMKSRHVDNMVGALTKRFCATSCPKLPTACCYILGYDLGLVPKTMLRLQAVEARRNGHSTPPVEEKCRYHTHTGCTLSLFKSPACIGYLCDGLKTSLEETYPALELAAFTRCLETFRDCPIDRSQVFDAMDGVIAAGRKLVAARGRW